MENKSKHGKRLNGGNDFCEHGRIKRDCPIYSKTICAHGFNITKCETCCDSQLNKSDDDWWISDDEEETSQAPQTMQALHSPPVTTCQIFPGSILSIGGQPFCLCTIAFCVVIAVVPGHQLPPIVLTFENAMWRISAGSVICLDDGTTVFLQYDAYCNQLTSPPALPQMIQSTVPEILHQEDDTWGVLSSSDSVWDNIPLFLDSDNTE